MIQAEVVGVNEVNQLLSEFPEHLFDNAKKQISKSVFRVQRNITNPLKTGANGLKSRSGNLARSIKFNVYGTDLESLGGSVYTDSIYAPIHETGGVIEGKDKYRSLDGTPYLNIPARANKTPAGIMRMTATQVFSQGGKIYKTNNKPKAKYVVVLNGQVMFYLVHRVEIPARLKMIKNAEDEIPTLLSNLRQTLLDNVE